MIFLLGALVKKSPHLFAIISLSFGFLREVLIDKSDWVMGFCYNYFHNTIWLFLAILGKFHRKFIFFFSFSFLSPYFVVDYVNDIVIYQGYCVVIYSTLIEFLRTKLWMLQYEALSSLVEFIIFEAINFCFHLI